MITVNVMDDGFKQAYRKAALALPVETLETPRQYGQRWRAAYRCRIDPASPWPNLSYIFDRDEDYTWFMVKWS